MKKTLTAIIIAIMTLSMVFPAFALNKAPVELKTTVVQNAANEVTVTVSIVITDQHVAACQAELSYDDEKFDYVSWTRSGSSSGMAMMNDTEPGKLTYAYINVTEFNPGTYELFSALFTFPETTVGSTAEFGLECNELYGVDGVIPVEGVAEGAEQEITTEPEINYFTITFVGANGVVISEQEVAEGENATAPADPASYMEGKNEWIFLGWDGVYNGVTADTTVTARFGMLGDANYDGLVNTGDATAVLRNAVGLITLEGDNAKLADYNKDTKVNTGDATLILRFCVGLS